jgi:Concanavalin A-like lectin/glucanases superfamily
MALTLNGSSQTLHTPQPFKSMPCSFSCWIKSTNVSPMATIMGLFATVNESNLALYVSAGAIIAQSLSSNLQTSNATSTTLITAGGWHHVAGVFSSTTLRTVYLDGVAYVNTSSNNPTVNVFNTLSVGATYYGTSTAVNLFPGTVAFPSTWNTNLTQADINTLYNSGSGSDPRVIEPGFLQSFLLLGASNTYLDDVTGLTWTSVATPTQVSDPFVVGAGTPIMLAQGATLVTSTTATLNGNLVLERGSVSTSEGFNYGTTTAYGTSPTPLSGSFTPGAFSIPVTGLTPSTIYHFQSKSTNTTGTGLSNDEYFTTTQVGNPLGQPYTDSRLGYACHFDQESSSGNYNPTTVLPLIYQSGAAYIRDDMNWQSIESSFGLGIGQYDVFYLKPFWQQAINNGLGIVAIIAGNTGNPLYTNNYDPTAMANFCVWLVGQLPTVILEILNEPNNIYQSYVGPTWQTDIVTLTNTVRAAVHAVSPSTKIIGYGAQGQQVLTMLANGGLADGIVYHPYDLNTQIPETCYEPPYLNYDNWVRTLRSHTSLPIWETERNGDTTSSAPNTLVVSEYDQALWNARRLLQSFGLGVDHTFIYQYTDGSNQSVVDFYLNPRQTVYVIQKILLSLAGTVGTLETVTLTNLSGGFDSADVYTYTYRSSTSTVVALWLGNHATNLPPSSGTATVSFNLLNTNVTASVLDTVVGTYTPLSDYSTATVGNTLSVSGFTVSAVPQLITVTGVTVASAPVVSFIFGATNVTTTTVTLNASITFDGGASSTVNGFHYGLTTGYGTTVSNTASLDTGGFSKNITGLTPGTTYHFQGFATNTTGTGTSVDNTFTTIALTTSPVLSSVLSAGGITATTAILNNSITTDGGSASTVTGFNYGVTMAYGLSVSTSATLDTGAFSDTVTGLLSSTTYHFQGFATNATGTSTSVDATFVTSSVAAFSPVLSNVLTATNIMSTTVVLNATITADGGSISTVTGFNYGLTSSYGSTVSSSSPVDIGAFSHAVSGLTASTTYYYQAFATNATGTSFSTDSVFVTAIAASPPVLSPTLLAVNITATTAILNNFITADGGSPSSVTGFNYGLTNSYGTTVSTTATVDTGAFAYNVTGLSPSTVYHFQGFATNATGTSVSIDAVFVTASSTSSPIINNVFSTTNVTLTTATLNASITADGGSPSTVTGFNYGLTTSYGLTVSTTEGIDIGPFSNNVTGLISGSTYHVQAFATNATGTGFGPDYTFTAHFGLILPGQPTGTPYGNFSYYDQLMRTVLRVKNTEALEFPIQTETEPRTLTHGVSPANDIPPEFQNEYVKLYKLSEYSYRI